MSVQSSGERALRAGYDGSLAAGCTKCSWLDCGERALRLAEAGKLVCFGCGGAAGVFYIPVRPGSVEADLHARVHEGMAGEAEVQRAKLKPGPKGDGPSVLGRREYQRRYKARYRAKQKG